LEGSAEVNFERASGETKMRSIATKWLTAVAALLALFFLATPPQAIANDDDDPPTRAARLSYMGGAVSFAPAGSDDWMEAVVNRPMTVGDKVWTDQGARAELRVDSYAIRLGEQTGFSFLNLDDRTVQIRLTEGTLNVRVRRMDDDQTLEVDTPNLAFNILRPGSYRINVNENGDATVILVRDGQGEVTGGGSAYPIHAGQTATFEGTDQLQADVGGYPGDDDFDRWCGDRDRRWDRSTASRYVSDDAVGYEDLDEYGGWRTVPEYGTVWFPHTAVVGWAPYRYGHWIWISPWGWTWVDDEPWGYAPFHYGRWVTVGGVWGWVPCPPRPAVATVAYIRPVYAPALVAWVGGEHWGFGVSTGRAAGVAWFPLGPRDVYCPSYRVSQRYVERVNVSNTVVVNRTQVTNVYNNVYVNKTVNVTNVTYQNQRANNAVTATSQASFTTAQPVGRNLIRVDSREVAAAPVAPPVAPQARSVLGTTAQARVRPPAQMAARSVVAKTPPPPPPTSVARQIQQVQSNGGRPVPTSQLRPAQEAGQPNVKVAQAAKPAALPPPGQRPNSNNPNAVNPNNRPGQPPAQAQQNPGRPPAANQPQPNANRPNANQPPFNANHPQPNANRPPNANSNNVDPNPPNPNQNNRNANRPQSNDRPPASRPTVDPQVQQRQQQQLEKLRQQQDAERQKLEQKQNQQQQQLERQKANQQREDQARQRQQQQLEQMERKHDQQQQKMEQRHEQEVQKQQQQQQAKPPKQDKPPKSDNQDRPH
jgi:hypothetical protein